MTNEFTTQVAELVAHLKSVAASQGYDIPAILREKAAHLRTRKAAHFHQHADALEAAASDLEAAPAMTADELVREMGDIAGRFDIDAGQAKRIAAVAVTKADPRAAFMEIWENEGFWV